MPSILSLPFRLVYLAHAWLFTFDILLLSRKRARTPLAISSLFILIITLLYLIFSCGNVPTIEIHVPNIHMPQMPSLPSLSNMMKFSSNNSSHISASSSPGFDSYAHDPHGNGSPPPSCNQGNSESASFPSPNVNINPCVNCPPPDTSMFQSQIDSLNQRITQLEREIERCPCDTKVAPSIVMPAQQSTDGLSVDQVKQIIKDSLDIYDADKIAKADYALESAGGSVLSTRCTETYYENRGRWYYFGVPYTWKNPTPRLAIQPTLAVGECWPFRGAVGYLVLQLSRRIKVTAFTLEHIPESIAPEGNITSAPNQFEVYGLEDETATEGTLLGTFNYDITINQPLQHFVVEEGRDKGKTFKHVELKILSNHGNIHFTCLYRFRVHGKPTADPTLY